MPKLHHRRILLYKKYIRLLLACMTIPLSTFTHDHTAHVTTGNHDMTAMQGMYGNYPMERDATGTSWIPDSTPMPAIGRTYHDWLFMMHGYAFGIYDRQGGPRGNSKFFSENMFMCTAHKKADHHIFGFRGM